MDTHSTQKKIKQYIVSYGEAELLGKGLKGQLRTGCDNNNKLFVFLINSLPISKQCQKIIDLQTKYSNLHNIARKIEIPVQSVSNQYLPMQYFSKTFQSQLEEMKQNQLRAIQLIGKFLQSYATLYYMRISHNNLSLRNIGITSQSKVKFMDFKHNTSSFRQCSMNDLHKFIEIMNPILQKKKSSKKFKIFQSKTNWQNIFKQWQIQQTLSKLYQKNQKNDYTLSNLVMIYNSIKDKNQNSYYLKIALLLASSFLVKYRETIMEANKFLDFYHKILIDAIQDPQYFKLTSTQHLCLTISLIPDLNHEYCHQNLNQNLTNNNLEYSILAQILITQFQVLEQIKYRFFS